MVRIRRHIEADEDPETLPYSERFEDWLGEHVQKHTKYHRLAHHPFSFTHGTHAYFIGICKKEHNSFYSML